MPATTDPWTRNMRETAMLARGETHLLPAVHRAQRAYLAEARKAILDPKGLTAAGRDHRRFGPRDVTRRLDQWVNRDRWASLLRQHVLPAARRWYHQLVGKHTRAARENWQLVKAEYLDSFARDSWADQVYDQVRSELDDSQAHGDTIDLTHQRIERALSPEAPTRKLRDTWIERERHGRDFEPDLDPARDYAWHNTARTRARWLVVGLTNRATLDAAGTTGDIRKRWTATPDERTRTTHWAANEQTVPTHARFQIGAAELRFPGDPKGPPAETANCRCLLRIDHADNLDQQPNKEPGMTSENTTAAASTEQGMTRWRGKLCPLDTRADHRVIGHPENGEVQTNDQMWLSHQESSAQGHDGKRRVGRIDRAWIEDGALWAEGAFNPNKELASEVARDIRDGFDGTVSVDLADAYGEDKFFDENGVELSMAEDDDELSFAERNPNARKLTYYHQWRLSGATLVQDPAFHTGWVALSDGDSGWEQPAEKDPARSKTSTTASGESWTEQVAATARATTEPPADAFADPQLQRPTKVTVGYDGRVYGHVACWDTDHISYPDQQVRAPRSETGYAMFHRHPVRCSTGERVRTGVLVMGTSHADLAMSTSSASAHYDNTGHVVADVRAGEDQHGIWVAGFLNPNVTPLQVAVLDRYSLSGDWRGGELVAALCVNTPGFPIPDTIAASGELPAEAPRTRVRTDAHGDQYALVAAGVVAADTSKATSNPVPSQALVDEVRALRDELAADRALREKRETAEADQRVNRAFARVNGQRLKRITEFAQSSGGDGRPKRATDGEDVARKVKGKGKKKPEGEGDAPDPRDLGEDHRQKKEEQGMPADPNAPVDPNQQQPPPEGEQPPPDGGEEKPPPAEGGQGAEQPPPDDQQGLLEDGDAGPSQEDWDMLSVLDALDEEDMALIEAMTGEEMKNPGDEGSESGLEVDQEGDDSEAGEGTLKPPSVANQEAEQEDPEQPPEDGQGKPPPPKGGDEEEEKPPPKKKAPPKFTVLDTVTAASKPNWVDQNGGLPPYVKRIARHLKKKGMQESHAIATAVNVVKKMCTSGDLNWPGKQNANKGSKAQACAAVAKWESMKAKQKGKSGGKSSSGGDSSGGSKAKKAAKSMG